LRKLKKTHVKARNTIPIIDKTMGLTRKKGLGKLQDLPTEGRRIQCTNTVRGGKTRRKLVKESRRIVGKRGKGKKESSRGGAVAGSQKRQSKGRTLESTEWRKVKEGTNHYGNPSESTAARN